MPSQAENNTSVEPPRRPCPGSSGVLLPVLKSNSGCPRCLVVLCDGLCVLPRLMKSPGLRRELLGDGRIRIRAPAECGIDLGLQRGTLIGECGASGRGGDDEGDDEAFHLASSLRSIDRTIRQDVRRDPGVEPGANRTRAVNAGT